MSESIDVLAVMESCIDRLDGWSAAPQAAAELTNARDAVAELIEACAARDAADAAINGAKDLPAAVSRLKKAKERYRAALARIGGAA